MTDEELARKAISGNVAAFESLLMAHYEKLYYTAMKYTNQHNDALDAIQEASCKAYLSIHKLNHPQYFMTWVTKILIRECYQLLQKQKKMIPFEDADLFKKLEGHQEAPAHASTLSAALLDLDQKYQSAIILHYYHDLPIKEVAEIMKKPQSTIKSYLLRGRKRMKAYFERSERLHGTII
ncbi:MULTISPECIES: sigma-70 family RNA polymerase sigma factor [Shouchella]|jgi:RNA polymerase sigma-70 factor (TIGR02954 family)|uniref:DNA-directed RNA polymerase ECF-type sigma factor n=2 Tax=Shouchella TaxID=2893057 RepID=Q5WAM8_SHOC1|nr:MULTISPECIES: sigma-70 family RNA polymerase sigma factor [Shouchella]MCM3311398.1 sigma-70 family RNA polymerase sigma factor [Psychrobacillus sp. MER TA 17]KKI86607.1 DNA-directed RNA polymerase subunit sigma [Shouchella clausii]MBX0319024.1 sigma-70 family RNA polymerase sigma factor [Shouchella clausii]MCM3381019.1 sigma-70 family RNA polymerase sigma factor [Shouchella rhizosphaerae]MDO7285066.1 sigma-70 family RNA polymerase sigma factor [Shouchella clausii]